MRIHPVLAISTTLVLAACATAPPPGPPPPSPAQIIASIHAAGRHDDSALSVTPLRDPAVQALADQAHQAAMAGHYAQAAAVLDQALREEPKAPDLLQSRAELAIRQHRYDHAIQLAMASWQQGPKLGSLCARNWQTVVEMRKLSHDSAGITSARKQRDACRVKPVTRM